MGMVIPVPFPCLKSSDKTDFATKVFFIAGKFTDALFCYVKKRIENGLWMEAADMMHFRWHSNRDHEIIDRKQVLLLFGQEFRNFILSAFGTIPVATGRECEMLFSAIWARINRPAPHVRCSADANIVDSMPLNFRKRERICGNVVSEDVGNVRHLFYRSRIRFSRVLAPSRFSLWVRWR